MFQFDEKTEYGSPRHLSSTWKTHHGDKDKTAQFGTDRIGCVFRFQARRSGPCIETIARGLSRWAVIVVPRESAHYPLHALQSASSHEASCRVWSGAEC